MKSSIGAVTLLALAFASPALASDVLARDVAPTSSHSAGIETVSVDIRSADGLLWSGTLTMGPQYGNASFSQSKNQFAEPCPGERSLVSNGINANSSINFNISRSNWSQEPNKFNINFSWTRSLPPCEGQGSDNFGFNRVIEIDPGGSVSIRGAGGAVVTVTRG